MISKTMVNELVGKEVWFWSKKSDFNGGILLRPAGGSNVKVKVTEGDRRGTVAYPHVRNIFLTREDLISANHEIFLGKVDDYCDFIENEFDLIRFCYSHPVADCGDATDWAARAAARKRAKELFDIEIDPEAAKLEKELESN